MKQSCANCRFFNDNESNCRRYPPQTYSDVYDTTEPSYDRDTPGSPGISTSRNCAFPDVTPTDWCGEWKTNIEQLP